MQQANIVITGAGIGNLIAAIALGQRGFRVDMIEGDPEWNVHGVGSSSSPTSSAPCKLRN